jgi:hypothetical protein
VLIWVNLLLFIFKRKYRHGVTLLRHIGQGLNLLDLLIFEMVIRAPVCKILIVSHRVLLIRNFEAVLAPDSSVNIGKGAKN